MDINKNSSYIDPNLIEPHYIASIPWGYREYLKIAIGDQRAKEVIED